MNATIFDMSKRSEYIATPGPFRADQLGDDDRYELSDGHSMYCSPSGGDHARGSIVGGMVLATDPDVESAGLDAGFTQGPGSLRAPDVAVGNVPDRAGWVEGVPPLAVEYASRGQDETELAAKISELLEAGTRYVWVVRLLPPRQVEVHTTGASVRIFGPGQTLVAPGVLRNPVAVEALFDTEVANATTLRNLLQRLGYESLDQVKAAGRDEGREEGALSALRYAVSSAIRARGLSIDAASRARLEACADVEQLNAWLGAAVVAEGPQFELR